MGCLGNLGCQCVECCKARGDVDAYQFDYSDLEEFTTIPVATEEECRVQASLEIDTISGVSTLRRAANEIEKLKAQVKTLQEQAEASQIEFNQCSGLLDDALRSIEILESDASRYQWMRDIGQDKIEVFIFNENNNCPQNFATWHAFTDMDKAIDDAQLQYPLQQENT